MQETTKKFLEQYRFALIGFSHKGKKFGNYIYRKLTARGLHIYPVNPAGGVVGGVTVYKGLEELPVKPQAVVLAVKASSVEAAIRDVIKAGIKHVWIMGSGYTTEVEQLCRDNGIELIHNRCILMYFGGFPHNLHYLAHRMWRKTPKLHPGCGMYDALGEWVDFQSGIDGSRQKFWLGLPEMFDPKKPHLMVMYLHQQGSDWSGVLTSGVYQYCRERGIIAVSTDYRGTDSHLNGPALGDIRQILDILKQKYEIPAWVCAGVSMGAISSVQLTYMLPTGLRPAGVVAVLPVYDIPLFFQRADDNFRKAISRSYGGDPDSHPDEYISRSPHMNTGRIDPKIPFAVFAGSEDEVAPADEHGRPLAEALKENGNSVHYQELDVHHDPEVFADCYREGLEFILKELKILVEEAAPA